MKAFVKYTLMMELADGITVEEFGKQMVDVTSATSEAVIEALSPTMLDICLDHGATSYSAHYDAMVIIDSEVS